MKNESLFRLESRRFLLASSFVLLGISRITWARTESAAKVAKRVKYSKWSLHVLLNNAAYVFEYFTRRDISADDWTIFPDDNDNKERSYFNY